MKGLKIGFIVLAAALITFGLGGMALAFHSGGVAECMGCHNIHDALSTSSLLIASDASSTCANASCHGAASAGSYHILSADVGGTNNGKLPRQMTPGGDFGWLLKTFTYSPRAGSSSTDLGEHHGHNIVAADIPGFIADDNNTTAPGGTMSGSQLGCTSCHDQHGKLRRLGSGGYAITGAPTIASGSYNNSPDPAAGQAVGVYRLLRGNGGPDAPATAGGAHFTSVFSAVVASTYNKSDNTAPVKVAYGAGVSDWCGTCHADMLAATSPKHTHPTNQTFATATQTNYNTYVGSGGTGVTGLPAFDTLVPFQNGNLGISGSVADYATLKTLDNNTAQVADGTSRVMCLSCHRAHASGFEFMGRWNNAGEFIAVDGVWPGTDSPSSIASQAKYAQGRTVAETTRGYNDAQMHYASYQRSLCNKCHAKD